MEKLSLSKFQSQVLKGSSKVIVGGTDHMVRNRPNLMTKTTTKVGDCCTLTEVCIDTESV
jgi:hypothetical protein